MMYKQLVVLLKLFCYVVVDLFLLPTGGGKLATLISLPKGRDLLRVVREIVDCLSGILDSSRQKSDSDRGEGDCKKKPVEKRGKVRRRVGGSTVTSTCTK